MHVADKQAMSIPALRVLLGFLIAPAAPALVLYLVGLLFVARWEAAFGPRMLAAFGYATALVSGVPTYLVLQRKRIASLASYLFFGALNGLATYVLFFGAWTWLSWGSYPEHALLMLKNSVPSGLIAVIYGTVAGCVFWLLVKARPLNVRSK